MKPHVARARLNALADFLDELPRKKFDFGEFATSLYLGTDKDCGSVGCALGWACTMPKFKRLGLRLSAPTGDRQSILPSIPNQNRFGVDVAIDLFGMTREEAENMFLPEFGIGSLAADATPKQVATSIRKFINRKFK